MKEKIHPTYHEKVLVHCACGETFFTRSTVKEIRVEICSKCHPFFTGKQKLVDSAGRVDRFQKRYAASGGEPKPTAVASSKAATKAKANATRVAARTAERSKAAAAAKPAKMVPIPPPPARKGGKDGRDGGRG